jgi:hypothetical protein
MQKSSPFLIFFIVFRVFRRLKLASRLIFAVVENLHFDVGLAEFRVIEIDARVFDGHEFSVAFLFFQFVKRDENPFRNEQPVIARLIFKIRRQQNDRFGRLNGQFLFFAAKLKGFRVDPEFAAQKFVGVFQRAGNIDFKSKTGASEIVRFSLMRIYGLFFVC